MFRLRNKKVLLTYKGLLNKDELVNYISSKKETTFARAAHEIGATGYEHTHVLVEWKTRPDWTDPRCLDFNDVHPNINAIRTNSHWLRSLNYIAKEDAENSDLRTSEKVGWSVDDVWDCPSMIDALRTCKKVSDVLGVKSLYASKPDVSVDIDWKANHWQEWCLNKIFTQNDREILWIFDTKGGIGKTFLGNTMYKVDPSNWLYIKGVWQSKDLTRIVENAVMSGWQGTYCIIDYPRSAEKHRIYDLIESMKDGMISTAKYDSRNLKFNRSIKLCCFANWKPQVTALSMDRWRIFEVERIPDMDSVFNINRLDANQIAEEQKEETNKWDWF